MLTKNIFFHQLKDFGLNSYESKLWVALLSRGTATAGELSDIAEVPRSRSYDVLESLEKKGFIMMRVGKPIKYMAVSPESVLDRVRNNIIESAQEQTSFLEKVEKSDVFAELRELHEKGITAIEPMDMTGSIRGRKNIYAQLDNLIRKAERSVIITTTADGFARKQSALKATLQKAAKRGVDVRFLVSGAAKANPELEAHIKVKNAPTPGRYCLIDGERLLFMVGDDSVGPAQDTAVWVHSPFFASALASLVDAHWTRT